MTEQIHEPVWARLRDLWSCESWRLRGLCARHNPELWFSDSTDRRNEAVEICSRCPVRVECLDAALREGEEFGIRGGVDFGEARREARADYSRRRRKAKT